MGLVATASCGWDSKGCTDAGGSALGLILPGLPQWRAGRRGWAFFFASSVSVALSTAAMTWGTAIGGVVLAIAFAIHVCSVADAIRQTVFPPYAPWVPWASAALTLGGIVYTPGLIVALAIALPVVPRGSHQEYAVNGWAYHHVDPKKGELVLVADAGDPGPWLGRVIAGAGDHVQYPDPNRGWASDPSPLLPRIGRPGGTGWIVRELELEIPPGHVLVAVSDGQTRPWRHDVGERLLLVNRQNLLGHAWARLYPLRERRLYLWAAR